MPESEATTLSTVREATEPVDPRVERFRAIYDTTYAPLSAYSRRRTVSRADADDVVAEVYLVAWRRLDDLPSGDAILPWLYGVAWRVLSNQRRGFRRRDALATRLESDPTATPTTDPTDEAYQIRDALSHLSADEQEILRLHCWEDLSHQEIAAALDVSVNAATIRLHRARKALARELERKMRPPTGQNLLEDPDTP